MNRTMGRIAIFDSSTTATIHRRKNIWSALMKATNPWITYRTRFLVKAKQLTTSLTFTDVLGRPHSGRKGDYLVESSDGVLRIAPRQIFEDIYVPLQAGEIPESAETPQHRTRKRVTGVSAFPAHLARKSPQPVRHISTPGLQSL